MIITKVNSKENKTNYIINVGKSFEIRSLLGRAGPGQALNG